MLPPSLMVFSIFCNPAASQARWINFNRRFGNSLNLCIWFMPCANRKRVSWCLVVLPRISQYSGCKKSLKSITIRTLLNVIALAPTPWHPHHNDGEPWSSWSIWHGEGRALKWIKWRGVRSLIWLYRRHKDPPRAYSALAFYRHTWVCVCVLNEV